MSALRGGVSKAELAMPDAHVDWCSHNAAKYAVINWHYSKAMPRGKLLHFGVWEGGDFVGAVVFGRGATHSIGKPYGLLQSQCCELVRVAFRQHDAPLSFVLSQCIRKLKAQCSGLRLLVSYADPLQDHHGGLYQACNWIYSGRAQIGPPPMIIRGRLMHGRTVHSKYGTKSRQWIRDNVDPNFSYAPAVNKYKYLYPLDRKMRKFVMGLSRPYPKPNASGENKIAT